MNEITLNSVTEQQQAAGLPRETGVEVPRMLGMSWTRLTSGNTLSPSRNVCVVNDYAINKYIEAQAPGNVQESVIHIAATSFHTNV